MNGTEARKLSKEEIASETTRLRTKLFELRQQLTTDKVEDNSQFKKIRRDVARLLTQRTALHAGKSGAAQGAASEKPAAKKSAPAKKPAATSAKKPAAKKAAAKN